MRQVLKRCNRRITRKDREKEKKKEQHQKEGGRAGSVKQPCNGFIQKGFCKYGDRCKFLHITMDEYEQLLREEKAKSEEVKEDCTSLSAPVDQANCPGENPTTSEKEEKPVELTSTSPETAAVTVTPPAATKDKGDNDDDGDDNDDDDDDDNDGGVEYSKLNEEDGQLCTMLPILTAEPHEGYRNKCSFTIGKNKEDQPCVGFRMGSFINGNVVIGEIE